jgi:hypothetical protein
VLVVAKGSDPQILLVARIVGSSSQRMSLRRYLYTHSLSVRWPMISLGVHFPSNGRVRSIAAGCLLTISAKEDAVRAYTSKESRSDGRLNIFSR